MSFQRYDKVNKLRELIAGGTLWVDTPVGTINAYGGSSAPSGWLLCQGQAISRTEYASLFAVIGTSFGSGDGSTTFNIPDLRGEFLRGAGTNSHSGEGNGGAVGEHQDATTIDSSIMEQSTHRLVKAFAGDVNYTDVTNADSSNRTGLTGSAYFAVESSVTAAYSEHVTTRPTNTSVNYIIKATQSALPTDVAAGIEELLADKDYLTFSD